jgi:hypothetical protein
MMSQRLSAVCLPVFGFVVLVAASSCTNGDVAADDDGGADGSVDAPGDSPSDQSSDCQAGRDASPSVADGAAYSALSDPTRWSTFDMATVNPGASGFSGAAFDGRYVYFVPDVDGTPANDFTVKGLAARYDTHAAFGAAGSWTTFDMTTVNPGSKGFQGAAFDGRYLYLAPYANTNSCPGEAPTFDGLVSRYDTEASFTSGSSWTTFDMTTVNEAAVGFWGASFDGRYVYFVPYFDGSYSGLAARYDTEAAFATGSSWTTFDTTTVNPGAAGFAGALFDGRYIYFVPFSSGLVTRYDTQAPLVTLTSWTTFDLTTVNAGATGFASATFDGRYVYFVPFSNGMYDGLVARYDTQAPFTTSGSWSTFDLTTVSEAATGFTGAAFDGRYVYFVPDYVGLFDSVVASYDTHGSFTTSDAWATFDVATLSAAAQGFWGAAFDGRYVYFVPGSGSSVVARFDARPQEPTAF